MYRLKASPPPLPPLPPPPPPSDKKKKFARSVSDMTDINKRLQGMSDTFQTSNTCECSFLGNQVFKTYDEMKKNVEEWLKVISKDRPNLIQQHHMNVHAYLNCVTNKSR
jgi:hypothetical protein